MQKGLLNKILRSGMLLPFKKRKTESLLTISFFKLLKNLEISNLKIIRLSPSHDYLPFDCDDCDLNDFLLNEAKDYLNKLLSVTYLFEYEGYTIAFFSVSNDKISHTDVDSNRGFKKVFQDFLPDSKRYKSYPAVKIGRLAVHKEFQKNKLGSMCIDLILQK